MENAMNAIQKKEKCTTMYNVTLSKNKVENYKNNLQQTQLLLPEKTKQKTDLKNLGNE